MSPPPPPPPPQQQQQQHKHPNQVFGLEPGLIVDDSTKHVFENSTTSGPNSNGRNTEQILSEKLNKLSLEERTRGIHELHGVADDENVTQAMISQKLREMTKIAEFANEDDTVAYRLALSIDKDYVERIKLLCLRADYYDSEKAASRVIAFFTFKMSLFGDHPLARDITYEDFEEDDKIALKKGLLQLLQERDRAGRAVIMSLGKAGTHQTSVQTLCRMFCYLVQTALRDMETQMKGIVFVAYAVGHEKAVSNRPEKLARLWWLLPARLAAMHFCCDSNMMHLFGKKMSQAMESHTLCRFRIHFGPYQDCIYNLMTFGIPKHVIPINIETGELELEGHRAWLETLHARERSVGDGPRTITPVNEIAVPGPMDVIVGRGSHSRSSMGYLRMRNLIEDYQEEYEKASRAEKTVISKKIFQEAQEAGCRFVRWTSEGFVECDEAESRQKISHTFRNMRRTIKDDRLNGGAKRYLSCNLAERS